jgi:hypothetical protein
LYVIGGGIVGAFAGSTASVIGGYELGTAINNYFEISSTLGRGALDISLVGLLAVPSVSVGLIGGSVGGGLLSILHDKFSETRNLYREKNTKI